MTRQGLLLALLLVGCDERPPIRVPGPTTAKPGGALSSSGASTRSVAVISRRTADAPVVAFRVVFDVGSADDPPGKEGVTALTATMTAESGTRDLTFAELSKALYPMAASVSVHVDRDQTVFAVDVASADLARFYPLLRDMLLAPRMDAESFGRLRARQKSELEDELKGADDEALGKEALQAALYDAHPYGHPAAGRSAALANLALGDVKLRRVEGFCRDRVTLGIAGAFPEGFDQTAARDLAELPACAGPRATLPAPTTHDRTRVVIIDKPSADATAISLGFSTPVTRASEDFPAMFFFTSYVGLHRQSAGILYNRLRELRGLNYGDYAYSEHFEQEGWSRLTLPNEARRQQMVSIWIRPVKSQNALFALRGALLYWRRAVSDGISDAEIGRFRGFLSRYLALDQQTESRRLGFALDDHAYHLETPYIDRMRSAFEGLDARKLQEVVKRDLAGPAMTIAIVARDGVALKKALLSNAPSPPAYDAPKPKEVTDEDKLIEALPLGLTDADVKVIPVGELF